MPPLQVLTTFEIPGTVDMWTVYSGRGKLEHAYLILSRTESSMILETGQEINELESSGFLTSSPTVFAGKQTFAFGACQFVTRRQFQEISATISL